MKIERKNNGRITLILNMRSRPKERAAFNYKTKRAYTKSNTRKFEGDLNSACSFLMAKNKYKTFSKDQAIGLKVFIYLSTPKSWSKQKKKDALDGKIFPITANVGDIDNHLKSILDGCNGILYEDDRSIVDIESKIRYAETDSIIIIAEEVNQ